MTGANRFWDEWPMTVVGHWNEAREKLNRLIRMVNRWTIDGMPSQRKARILAEIECAETTWAADQVYMDDLSAMREYISSASVADDDEEEDESNVVRCDEIRRIIARHEDDGSASKILDDLRDLLDR
jgi:hypothetical protein